MVKSSHISVGLSKHSKDEFSSYCQLHSEDVTCHNTKQLGLKICIKQSQPLYGIRKRQDVQT